MHAVTQNSQKIATILIEGKHKAEVDVNAEDNYGRTAVHHLVTPLPYGSYENVELLKYLSSKGAELDILLLFFWFLL